MVIQEKAKPMDNTLSSTLPTGIKQIDNNHWINLSSEEVYVPLRTLALRTPAPKMFQDLDIKTTSIILTASPMFLALQILLSLHPSLPLHSIYFQHLTAWWQSPLQSSLPSSYWQWHSPRMVQMSLPCWTIPRPLWWRTRLDPLHGRTMARSLLWIALVAVRWNLRHFRCMSIPSMAAYIRSSVWILQRKLHHFAASNPYIQTVWRTVHSGGPPVRSKTSPMQESLVTWSSSKRWTSITGRQREYTFARAICSSLAFCLTTPLS